MEEHRTSDQKVAGPIPGRSSSRVHLLQGQLSMLTFILISVHCHSELHVT